MILVQTTVDIRLDEIIERIEWVKAIVTEIKDEGTIQKIREIVNDPLLDD